MRLKIAARGSQDRKGAVPRRCPALASQRPHAREQMDGSSLAQCAKHLADAGESASERRRMIRNGQKRTQTFIFPFCRVVGGYC